MGFLALGNSYTVVAQTNAIIHEVSYVPVLHYSPKNSNVKEQTWSIVQDERGVIYVADEDGIKVFDGQSWSHIPTESGTTVRSLAVSERGIIYYGAQGEFGRILPDESGRLRATSLSVASETKGVSFADVWGTHIVGELVFFQTLHTVFTWDGEQIRSWSSETGYHTSFSVGDSFFVREFEVGLLRYNTDSLVLVPGGEEFANVRIYLIDLLENGDILIGSQERGLYRYSSGRFSRFKSELDQFQAENSDSISTLRLYTADEVGPDQYAIGTLDAGLVIIDSDGHLISSINVSDGLPDNTINSVYSDHNGALWLALDNNGVVYLDIYSPLTRFGATSGIRGRITNINRSELGLLLATGAGLVRLREVKIVRSSGIVGGIVTPIDGIKRPWLVQDLMVGTAVATDQGLKILQLNHGNLRQISCNQDPVLSLYEDAANDILLAGTKLGLKRIVVDDEACNLIPIKGVTEEIRSIEGTDGNTIWLGTRHEGVIMTKTGGFSSGLIDKEKYSIDYGLPSTNITVKKTRGVPVFYSEQGPYRYNELTERFELDTKLWPFEDTATDSLFALTEDELGTVWMVFPDSIVKAIPSGTDDYNFEVPEALKFRKTSTSTILVEPDGIVWFNDGNELIRYNPKLESKGDFRYFSVIGSAVQNSTAEIIFNGSFTGPDGGIVLNQPDSSILSLDYSNKDLTFHVSATTFTYPEAVRYQIRIDGRDSKWSKWSKEAQYSITGLDEGFYSFRVRAKDAAGRLSEEARYSYIILPPLYRSWWAYLLYVVGSTLLVISARKYWMMVRAQKLAAEQAKELEKEREFSRRLQEANDNLRKANKLKDEFLATTSHELRTPLTAILGFTTILKDEIPEDADYHEFLDIIEDAGNRLMETLNSLLDLAILRAGTMDINLETCDIYHQCLEASSGLREPTRRKGLKLSIERPSEAIFVNLDVPGFQRIVQILVGNSVKFTTSGSIQICFDFDLESVFMHVRDTGIGIDEAFLPRLFEEFVQESDGPSRTHEGSGLGLAITARLVQLMNGQISVTSEKGVGSTFTVSFPRVSAPVGEPIRIGGIGKSVS